MQRVRRVFFYKLDLIENENLKMNFYETSLFDDDIF